MLRALMSAIILVALILGISQIGLAVSEDRSHGKWIGVGAEVTSPFSPPNTFPASGLSIRLWIADLVGFELDAFLIENSPSFSPRTFVKLLNTDIVDIYLGAGLSLFIYAEKGKTLLFTPLQGLAGIEIRLTSNIVLNAELGLFGHSGKPQGVTSGMGIHFYF